MNLANEGGTVRIVGTQAIALPIYLQNTEAAEEIKRGYPDLGAVAWFDLGLESEGAAAAFPILKRLLWEVTEILDRFEPVF
jgi:hypothetical protein